MYISYKFRVFNYVYIDASINVNHEVWPNRSYKNMREIF